MQIKELLRLSKPVVALTLLICLSFFLSSCFAQAHTTAHTNTHILEAHHSLRQLITETAVQLVLGMQFELS